MPTQHPDIAARPWPGLLIAPLVALTQQSLSYALVTPSCAHQTEVALHAVAVLGLLVTLALTAQAWIGWRRATREALPAESAAAAPDGATDAVETAAAARHRQQLLMGLATLSAALSALVCAAMWLPVWVLSPCLS